MADIYSKILSKYQIDMAQENIFKLYKIDSADIASAELEQKISDTRKRWNNSVNNGTQEKAVARDKARLEKADKYESILRDAKLRKEAFKYYNKTSAGGDGGNAEFARDYFALVATSTKIKKDDVDFFFRYYPNEKKKNKQAILQMLSKEYHVGGLSDEKSEAMKRTDSETEDKGEEKKSEQSALICNRFQRGTEIAVRDAYDVYEKAASDETVRKFYPDISDGFYEFIGVYKVETAEQFEALMKQKSDEAFERKQSHGAAFVPLVDLFNKLYNMTGNNDVRDNIEAFKLLLQFPALTPYMETVYEMKKSTLKGLYQIASAEYGFRDESDFILNYYLPLRDHFNVVDSGISGAVKNAQKKAKQNKILNALDKNRGKSRRKKISIGAEILYWLVYWPIFLVYLLFEISRLIFTRIKIIWIPLTALVFVWLNSFIPEHLTLFSVDPFWDLRKIFTPSEWVIYAKDILDPETNSVLVMLAGSGLRIAIPVLLYVIPTMFAAFFIREFFDDFNKRFDWIGHERTFRELFKEQRRRTEEAYFSKQQNYAGKQIPRCLINILCAAVIVAVVLGIKYALGAASV